jgi:hypothetical protein
MYCCEGKGDDTFVCSANGVSLVRLEIELFVTRSSCNHSHRYAGAFAAKIGMTIVTPAKRKYKN